MLSRSVAVAVPCAGPVEPRFLRSAMNLTAAAERAGITVELIGVTERSLIHSARNWLSKEFLQTKCEWLFWADSDMILEPRTIPVMMSWAERLKATFLTGIYYQRMGDHRPVLGLKRFEGHGTPMEEYSFGPVCPKEGAKLPFQVDVTGFGCVLLHRSVYDGAKYPYFRFLFSEEENKDSYISEDIYFCMEARKRGVSIWAVPELECGHIGTAPVITRKDFDVKKASGEVKVQALVEKEVAKI